MTRFDNMTDEEIRQLFEAVVEAEQRACRPEDALAVETGPPNIRGWKVVELRDCIAEIMEEAPLN